MLRARMSLQVWHVIALASFVSQALRLDHLYIKRKEKKKLVKDKRMSNGGRGWDVLEWKGGDTATAATQGRLSTFSFFFSFGILFEVLRPSGDRNGLETPHFFLFLRPTPRRPFQAS